MLALAVLAAATTTLLAPAAPAHAEECTEYVTPDGPLCDDPLDPPHWPPQNPHPVALQVLGDFDIQVLTNKQENTSVGPNETCRRSTLSTGVTGTPAGGTPIALYGFEVVVTFCISPSPLTGDLVITKPVVTARRVLAPSKPPEVTVSQPRSVIAPSAGVSSTTVLQDLIFQVCNGTLDNCTNFRHFIQLIVTPGPITPTTAINVTPEEPPGPLF